MEEKIVKESQASYFKSATHVMTGALIMTSDSIRYSGTQDRLKMDHGALGNKVRDKLEAKMGYDNPEEQFIFDIPLADFQYELKRFGLSKRLIITDKEGTVFKLTIPNKAERNEWPEAIDNAKKGVS